MLLSLRWFISNKLFYYNLQEKHILKLKSSAKTALPEAIWQKIGPKPMWKHFLDEFQTEVSSLKVCFVMRIFYPVLSRFSGILILGLDFISNSRFAYVILNTYSSCCVDADCSTYRHNCCTCKIWITRISYSHSHSKWWTFHIISNKYQLNVKITKTLLGQNIQLLRFVPV